MIGPMDVGLSGNEMGVQARAHAFATQVASPRAAAIDHDEQYPWDVVEALKEAGFLGMTLPAALGGQGRSFLEAVLVIEEMAKACTATARIVVATNMGTRSPALAYGNETRHTLETRMV